MAHAFLTTVKNPTSTVNMQLNAKAKQQFEDNVHMLECIVDAVLLCGRQGLPL